MNEFISSHPIMFMNGLTGIVLLFLAILFYSFPPKKINHWYGYRTRQSMSSQKKWDVSQRYSSRLMIGLSFLLLLFGAIDFMVDYSTLSLILLTVIPLSIGFLGIMYMVEQKLKTIK